MKSLKKTRRIQIIIVAFVALAVSTALIGYAMKDGINYFKSPTQVVENTPSPSEVFRIGGLVEEGSLVIGESETIKFRITDTANTIDAIFTGVRPDLFKEGQGTVATGSFVNGVFVATEILAKHDENYMPKEVVDALKDQGYYVDPEAPANGS